MSAKDTFIGQAKQIVAEIVGDGRLAEEGSRQASEGDLKRSRDLATCGTPPDEEPPKLPPANSFQSEPGHMNENRFASLLGLAALKVWPDLPRDAQERLFAAAVDDGVVANDLAEFLHDRHPRTAHPPKSTRFA
ncbi:hypothetical protein [Bradyrhizobium sp. S3.9.1]|uniref:hypothetical protein n=1 Tax=Bradyrhizobium sp. S3.9.1 TaxID=3156431 RepID=UPI0033988083